MGNAKGIRPIGPNSKSFLRHGKEFAFSLNFSQHIQSKFDDKKQSNRRELLNYLLEFANDKAVINADLLNIKDMNEIKAIKIDLKNYIAQNLNLLGEDAKGIVELHLTSDETCKSAHIHYWGSNARVVEQLISIYAIKNHLTLSRYQNYHNNILTWDRIDEINFISGKLKDIESLNSTSIESEFEKVIKDEDVASEELEYIESKEVEILKKANKLLEDIENNQKEIKDAIQSSKEILAIYEFTKAKNRLDNRENKSINQQIKTNKFNFNDISKAFARAKKSQNIATQKQRQKESTKKFDDKKNELDK